MMLAMIRKELLLLCRDIHGLLLLFVMPLIFIVVMSLALRDVFSEKAGLKVYVNIIDHVESAQSQEFIAGLKKSTTFIVEPGSSHKTKMTLLIDQSGKPSSPAGGLALQTPLTLAIDVEPDTESYVVTLFTAHLRETQVQQALSTLNTRLIKMGVIKDAKQTMLDVESFPKPDIRYQYQGANNKTPNSVQQNVPAWMVFAMFFVVVPLSNAFLAEEKSGMLRRLKTYNVSPVAILAGKFIPYFFINQLQIALMLCVGVWVMPLMGADRLSLGDSMPALLLMSMATSLMALGYALCISVIAKTTEQATTLGGVGNILLAAIGGVMVPVFVMPAFMQDFAQFSPMYWSVQGFLDIFLRGGNVSSILFKVELLSAIGLLLLAVSALILRFRRVTV